MLPVSNSRCLFRRNAKGEMIPLSAFVTIMRQSGPDRIIHYNGFPSVDISGGPAP
ncbi:efflux RND transporter permease subunit, partial [Salmonella enterica subsp. enterica serovar Kentucky]|nr:efflux RND transporter permease subunit [Salmonella enterica subsp. enterica serovar Kentucky]